MYRMLSKQRFDSLVTETCSSDPDFRHEIERTKNYGAYHHTSEVAYDLFCRQFLSLREAFGLTEKG